MDPRPAAIADRLSGVERIIAVGGSKGGIGKSIVSTGLALALTDLGLSSGLFDLDFTSPSDHVILGADLRLPDEGFGIDPVPVHAVRVMSAAFFVRDIPTPLRGTAATEALIELLAVTRWGDLDVLVLDLPPGLGDVTLDVIRFLPRTELLLLATASRLVTDGVQRALRLVKELGMPLLGVAENLRRGASGTVAELAHRHGAAFLGAIPFDDALEQAIGDVAALRSTAAYGAIAEIAARIG